MKQNQKKNSSKRPLVLPTTMYFTIQDVVKVNPAMLTESKSDITIRVRLTNKIEAGEVAEIGSVPGGKGRPQKVFAITPVTQTVLNKAKQDNINLVDNAEKLLVHAVSVSNPPPVSAPSISVSPSPSTPVGVR